METLNLVPSTRSPAASSRGKKMKSNSRSGSDQENIHPNVQTTTDPDPPLRLVSSPSRTKKPSERISISIPPPKSFDGDGDAAASVKVVVRIRPVMNPHDKEGRRIVRKLSPHTLSVGDRSYKFHHVLASDSTQEDVFNLVGVPLVQDSLAGFNTSILSYGQTGSGKTYTMWGPPSAMLDCHSINAYQGIAPRIFHMLFSDIHRKQAMSEKQINYQCRCSFLEISNEQINNLLNPTQRNLQIGEDAKIGVHVENLTDEYVTTVDDVIQILVKGLSNRKIGTTSVNSKSSRSHIIFTCIIESWCKESSAKCFSSSKTSRISLIDLAGSDNDKLDDAGRNFIKEGKHIKKSLSKLGKVVNILAEAALSGKDQNIPHVDSCLTHLLQDTLGGNAKVTVICAIPQDERHKVGILSTLRFGERSKLMQNKAVINAITEDDVTGLSDQIRQLKEELIRAKTCGSNSVGTTGSYFKGQNARESLNLLRVSLNRSLILHHLNNNLEEELDADEDVTELCAQLSNAESSFGENANDNSMCASEESLNTEIKSDLESRMDSSKDKVNGAIPFPRGIMLEDIHPEKPEPQFPTNGRAVVMESTIASKDVSNSIRDDQLEDSSRISTFSINPCQHLPFLQDPTICVSPKISSNLRKSIINSSSLAHDKNNRFQMPKSNSEQESFRHCDPNRMSLQSSKVSPTESLAASLHRGLQIIDYHQRNSAAKRTLVGLSFEHLASFSCQPVHKVDAGVETSREGSFLCAACKRVADVTGHILVNGNSDMQMIPFIDAGNPEALKNEGFKDESKIIIYAMKRQLELETICAEQATTIKQLNCLVNQCKHEPRESSTAERNQGAQILHLRGSVDGVAAAELKSENLLKIEYENCTESLEGENLLKGIQDKPNHGTTFDTSEREALLQEIEYLTKQVKSDTNVSASDSLLEQIRNGSPSPDCRGKELEQERQRWTESESRWISLAEELRLDLELNRRLVEKKEMELTMERKCAEELDDALQRAILGHARIIEHYAELQENHNELLGRHRKVMEGIAKVKQAAAKAGSKGTGKAFVAALAAELSTLRAERERERVYLKEQNKGLRIQLRDTAEAVHAAGELLVRLREAEEAATVAEEKYRLVEQENEKLRKQVERMKKKHATEMVTVKHYLAESRLPESALERLYHQDSGINAVGTDAPPAPAYEQEWRTAFRPSYQ